MMVLNHEAKSYAAHLPMISIVFKVFVVTATGTIIATFWTVIFANVFSVALGLTLVIVRHPSTILVKESTIISQ